MGKTFHYLAGLHRSGNTVLSAILNQHPKIYVSPISSLVEYMWLCHSSVKNLESAKINKQDAQRSIKLISSMHEKYYEDVDSPVVFDRCKTWISPENIHMIKTYITKNPKIIFTTRPILECIASFIAIDKQTVINNMIYSGFKTDPKLKENENLADFLVSNLSTPGFMRELALESIDNPENSGIIHVVKYEDLLSNPQETMRKVYDFIELEPFKHNFKNIKKLEEYDDSKAGLVKDLHKVRRVLGKGDVTVEDYLTPYTIEKYKDLRYF